MKERVSSRVTWWMKWGYPLFAVGFCVAWFTVAIMKFPPQPGLILLATMAPIIMVTFILAFTRKLIRPLADKVWDEGDALIVRRDGQEERIALANIVNLSCGRLNGIPKVTLVLREPSRFGDRISYLPMMGSILQTVFPAFQEEPKSVQELIRRVDAARRL